MRVDCKPDQVNPQKLGSLPHETWSDSQLRAELDFRVPADNGRMRDGYALHCSLKLPAGAPSGTAEGLNAAPSFTIRKGLMSFRTSGRSRHFFRRKRRAPNEVKPPQCYDVLALQAQRLSIAERTVDPSRKPQIGKSIDMIGVQVGEEMCVNAAKRHAQLPKPLGNASAGIEQEFLIARRYQNRHRLLACARLSPRGGLCRGKRVSIVTLGTGSPLPDRFGPGACACHSKIDRAMAPRNHRGAIACHWEGTGD